MQFQLRNTKEVTSLHDFHYVLSSDHFDLIVVNLTTLSVRRQIICGRVIE